MTWFHWLGWALSILLAMYNVVLALFRALAEGDD